MITSVIGGFTDAAGAFTLQNFAMVFQEESFLPAVRNTAIIVVFSVTFEFFVALFWRCLSTASLWIRHISIFVDDPDGVASCRCRRDVDHWLNRSWLDEQPVILFGDLGRRGQNILAGRL